MSDQWPSDPGGQPPVPPSTPAEWGQAGIPPLAGPPAYGEPPVAPGPPVGAAGTPPTDPNRTLKIVAAVLAVLLLIAVGALVLVSRSSSGDVAATGSTTTTSRPTSSTAPTPGTSRAPGTSRVPQTTTTEPAGPAPTQAELDAEVAEISSFIEQARNLKFKQPVKAKLASDEEFSAGLLAEFEEDRGEMELQGKQLKALGLIPGDLDVVETMRKLLDAGVLGYYDPESDELVVRGVALTPFVRQTIAHELVHALDDQHFDLDRKAYDDRQDEIGFGFSAIAEGNARFVEDAFLTTFTDEERRQRTKEEVEFAKNADLSGIPIVMIKMIDAPYSLGEPLIRQIVARGGQPGVDQAVQDPPDTSRQVLHPQDYLQRVERVEVAKPAADPGGKVIDEGVFGELMIGVTLEDELDRQTARAAGDGWLGDWYVAWDNPDGTTCLRATFKMESAAERDELLEAFDAWAASRPAATVEKAGADGMTLTSCSVPSGGGGESPL